MGVWLTLGGEVGIDNARTGTGKEQEEVNRGRGKRKKGAGREFLKVGRLRGARTHARKMRRLLGDHLVLDVDL